MTRTVWLNRTELDLITAASWVLLALGLGRVDDDDVGLLPECRPERQAEVHRDPDDQGDVGALQAHSPHAREEQLVVGGYAHTGQPAQRDGEPQLPDQRGHAHLVVLGRTALLILESLSIQGDLSASPGVATLGLLGAYARAELLGVVQRTGVGLARRLAVEVRDGDDRYGGKGVGGAVGSADAPGPHGRRPTAGGGRPLRPATRRWS